VKDGRIWIASSIEASLLLSSPSSAKPFNSSLTVSDDVKQSISEV
jgi:hypothetical protein